MNVVATRNIFRTADFDPVVDRDPAPGVAGDKVKRPRVRTRRIWLLLCMLRELWPAGEHDLSKVKANFLWQIKMRKSFGNKKARIYGTKKF